MGRFTQLFSNARRRGAAAFLDNFFGAFSRAGSWHPKSRPARHNVEVLRDIPYVDDHRKAHLLDIYRPLDRQGPLPVVLYVHGGGFRTLSKETHWLLGLAFARNGYIVANINYRLAPKHPYPAALADACAAALWVKRHIAHYGGDPERMIYSGESAGGNLVTALAVAGSYRWDAPWARALFEAQIDPCAVIPACGILQVSDTRRFARLKSMPALVQDVIDLVGESYLPAAVQRAHGGLTLADPLLVLEQGKQPDRPLPPFFVFVGTKDPLLDDTRRLKNALDALSVPCEAAYYPGGLHGFHAMMVPPEMARQCWKDQFTFLTNYAHSGAQHAEHEMEGVPSAPANLSYPV